MHGFSLDVVSLSYGDFGSSFVGAYSFPLL